MTPRRRISLSRLLHDFELRHLATSAIATVAGLGVALAGFAGATIAASSKHDAAPNAVSRVARVVVANHVTALARGWYAYGSGTEIVQTKKTQLGVKAVRTKITRQTVSGGAAFDAGVGGLRVTPSTRYSLTAWVKGAGALTIRVGLHNKSGNAIGFARVRGTGLQFRPSARHWTPYHLTFATSARTSSIVVLIGGRERQRAQFLVGSMKLSSRVLADGRSPRRHHPQGPPTTTTATTPGTTTRTTTTPTTTTTTTVTSTTTSTPTTTTAPTTTTTPTHTTTTTATTTTTTTTPTTSSTSYAAAIAYTRTRAPFTVQRDVPVSSASALQSAITAARCGDDIHATAAFTVTFQLDVSAHPSCPARIELEGVSFAYASANRLPDVYIHGAANLLIYDGDVTTGSITVYQASNITWWGFHVHNVPHDGLDLFPVGGPIDGCDFQGEIDHWGGYIADDPHAENGTGFHGVNIADAGTGIVTNTRLALYVHDGPAGAGVQVGAPNSNGQISGLTLYLKAVNLTMRAQSQVAGNAVQEWGAVPIGMHIPYLEASDLEGRANDGEGVYSGVSMAGIHVDYGRATNTNQNPYLSRTEYNLGATEPWDSREGQVYRDVSPS